MKDDLTIWRLSQGPRIAALVVGAGGAAVALYFCLDDAKKFLFPVIALAAVVGFVGFDFGLARVAAQVPLRSLDVDRRLDAVNHAWARPPAKGGSMWVWGGVVAGIAAFASIISTFSESRWVWVVLASLAAPVAAAIRQLVVELRRARVAALRASGVEWVRSQVKPWVIAGAEFVGKKTLERFRQSDPEKKPFVFWVPRFDGRFTSDMPPPVTDYMALAVGEFVGYREGRFLDVRDTSMEHAQLENPDVVSTGKLVMGEGQVKEREAHFVDVVTVDYARTTENQYGEPAGTFRLGLANAQGIEFMTLEAGTSVEAALDDIRSRTRKVKASGGKKA